MQRQFEFKNSKEFCFSHKKENPRSHHGHPLCIDYDDFMYHTNISVRKIIGTLINILAKMQIDK
jgi:hypothetical protein